MGLKIQQRIALKGKTITLLIATFALVAQPLYGFVSAQIASATTTTDHVVINEIMAKPGTGIKEWVELYNPTSSAINLEKWRLTDGSGNFTGVFASGVTIPAHGFLVRESESVASQLHDLTKNLRLESDEKKTLVDSVTYNGITEGKSYARTYDAASTWVAQAMPSKGSTNNSAPVIPAVSAEVNAENFNTVDGNYKGISVGFNTKNFGTVSAVSVQLTRADDSVVIKNANQGVLDIINGNDNGAQLTVPFVIQSGSFSEQDDLQYWRPASVTSWTTSTAPVNVKIIVTDENGSKEVVNSVFHQGIPSWPMYEDLLPAITINEVVRGNTATGENQAGWLFNRDSKNATAIEFSSAQASTGAGSLYVKPIGLNPAAKLIAEYFGKINVSDLKSVSYDYMIAGNGTSVDSDDFYVNVYANIDDTNKYYDCRYDYVSSVGSTSTFTTSRFDVASVPTAVVRSGTARIAACPTTLAGMPEGSHVRAFALNVGQTNDSDTGLAGFLDNVVVNTKKTITTYDFEADTVSPSVPTNGMPHTTHERDNDFYFTWSSSTDDLSTVTYEFQSSTTDSTDSDGSLVGAWNSQRDGNSEQKHLETPTIHSTGAPDGKYYWQVRAIDASGNKSAWSAVWNMTIDSKAPLPPNDLSLKVTASGLVIPSNGFTNQSGVTAAWVSNNAEPVTYVYKYWNDVATSQYKQSNPWENPLSGMSYAGVVNEGEGRHFFCVAARDQAGNESACSVVYGFTYDVTAPDAAINGVVAGQDVAGDVLLQGVVNDKNPMNTYFIITGPSGYSQSSFYGDGRGTHEYLWKAGALKNGTYKIQFETRDRAGNKDSGSVASVLVVVNNPQPVVVGENFNTHSGVDYKGVNVGFNIAAFKSVSAVSVNLYDDKDNLLVTNAHNKKLLDLIASGVMQLSTPFITDQGTYTEEYWSMGNRAWKATDKPAKAVVVVSGTNNAGVLVTEIEELTLLTEPNGWTFEGLMPVVVGVLPPPSDTAEQINDGSSNPASNSITSGSVFSALPLANLQTPANIFFAQLGGGDSAETTDDTAVLGVQSDDNDSSVKGSRDSTVAAIETDSSSGSLFGFAWYWWLIIVAAFAAILYAFARRRSQDM